MYKNNMEIWPGDANGQTSHLLALCSFHSTGSWEKMAYKAWTLVSLEEANVHMNTTEK